jgi:orotidine-5'-phosphate decarboxylase
LPHFVDTLLEAVKRKGSPVCVGIDPVFDRLPESLRGEVGRGSDLSRVDAIVEFVGQVLEVVAPHVPCVKFQSACFERYGVEGLGAYHYLIGEAKEHGLLVIGDSKRGDIGVTAEHYAAASLLAPRGAEQSGGAAPDAMTINSYFGADGITPFTTLAAQHNKGLFALVRTSNPGGDAIQSLQLADGRTVAEAVASLVAKLGSDPKLVGKLGYSLLGAVVGATKPGDAAKLRALMPQQIFLVPGFGAQGGSADDVRACFKADGSGAIVTASRSITYAFDGKDSDEWATLVEAAAVDMKKQIAAILA